MKRALPIVLPLLILLGIGVYFYGSGKSTRFYKKLPILGNHSLDSTYHGSTLKLDTIWHHIPEFSFINQDGKTVTQADVEGKVYVADYFFTTCQSICPIMSKQLDRVAAAWKKESDFRILSYTVDPETDTPQQLKSYAALYKANTQQWMFLTGEKPALYELARKGYLLDAQEGNGGAEDFIHTQNFALIDRHGRIRGYYDGTDSTEVNNLIKDIDFLLQEK